MEYLPTCILYKSKSIRPKSESMRKKIISSVAVAALAFAAGTVAHAQTYSNAVMSLNPAGYWPLAETTQPPFAYFVATNLGTAGDFGNGVYQTWYQPVTLGTSNVYYISNNIVRTAGATGDGDQAMQCNFSAGRGQYVVLPRFTNGVANPVTTIQAPFSIEVWVNAAHTNHGLLPIVSEGRTAVQGNASSTPPYTNTMRGFELGTFNNFLYFQVYKGTRSDHNGQTEIDGKFLTPNAWYHVVVTYDGTTEKMYTNGVQAASASSPGYVIDPTTPLIIGNGPEVSGAGGSAWDGAIDDVAIYPQALSVSQVAAHYAAASSGTYVSTVQADSPSLYFRLNEPQPATPPDYTTFPVANNYGSLGAAANGLYQPGTAPGVMGPAFAGFGGSSTAVAINGFFGGVDVGGGVLPSPLNPTGNQPFAVVTWFQGNPADAPARFQSMVGHSDSSWRLTMDGASGDTVQLGASVHFNPGAGPELQFVNTADVVSNHFVLNDGKWHMAAGVFDGTTEYMYLDGVLAKTNTTAVGSILGTNLDLLIGGDPQYTVPTYNGSPGLRYFDGQVAQVAFFTNSLTAAQIQQLYGAAGVPPTIISQPPASASANVGTNLSLATAARGSAPLAFQWYRTNGTAVAGQTTATLTFNPVTTNNAGSYYVVVTNSYGAATSSVVAITVFGPPTIQNQSSTDIRVFVGTTPTLRATATGPSLTYQWTRNGSPISGATNSSYVVTNTASVGVSTYNCTITNFVSSTSLSPITVSVLADPTAPYPVRVLADHPIAYFRLDETDNGSGNNGVTGYDYAGGFNGSYSNTVLSQFGYDPATDPDTAATFGGIDSYLGDNSTYLSFGAPSGSNVQFSVEAWAISAFPQSTDAGLVTIGYGNGGEQIDLDTGGTASKNFRFIVRDAAGAAHVVNGTVASYTSGVWHHVVGVCDEVNGHVYLYVDGALNGSTTITPGTGILGLTVPLSIGSRIGDIAATDYTNQFAGSIDDVSFYNYALSATQIAAHYFAAGVPPVITQIQPFNEETNSGATATFTITATGTAPLSYQWYDNFGVAIPGATTATLALPNVQQSQEGLYSVTVTNLYGSTSTNANLIVDLGAPVITADLQPTNLTVYTGVPVNYSVQVSGSAPFSYQWYKNGGAISGATSSSYSFPALLGTNSYYVSITNQYSFSQNGGPTFSSTGTVVGVVAPTLNPSDYTYKMKITFAGYNRSETLADFPVLVQLGTNLPGFSYSQLASPSGSDLRFTDSGGTRVLPHEIDEWNPGGISPVWVQVSTLSTNTDFIWAYWGNPANTAVPASQTNGAVWVPQSFENLPAYSVVYHMKEANFPFADSTTMHPATNGIAPTVTNGIVGQAGLFNASYLDAGTVNLDDTLTLSAWVNINNGVSDIQTIWANQVGGFGNAGFALYVDNFQTSDQQLRFASGNGAGGGNETGTSPGAVPFGAWHMIAAAINRTNGTVNFYVDGVFLNSSSSVVRSFTNDADLNLGRFINGAFPFHGAIDEARIRGDASSSNWVWASYMTVAQNSTFQNYASISSSAVTINAQLIGGKLVLTWPNGTLQSAPTVNGQYSDLTGVTSPYTNTPSGPQQYYRVKVR